MPERGTGQGSGPRAVRRFTNGVKWAVGIVVGAILAATGGAIYATVSETVTDPVDVVVSTDPSVFEAGEPLWTPYFYYLPISAEELGRPPEDCRARRSWAFDRGGADADETRLTVTLLGQRSAEVSIRNLRVEVLSRKPLDDGVVAACPVGGASKETHGFAVDLGTARRSATVTFTDPRTGDSSRVRLTLAEGESEELDVLALTMVQGVVEWRLLLDIVADGELRTIAIDDDGEPFRTAGTGGLPMFRWTEKQWIRWQ